MIKDGVGTIKGTSTNMWANISANVIYLYPAGNYVLSIDEPKTFNINLKGIYTDEEIFEFVIPAGSKTKNVAFKKEVYSMYAFISGFAVGTTLDDTIKIQLEKGSTATDFEQYGASPSPDYPSKIKTVGSNVNYYNKETEEIGFVLPDGSLQSNNTVWTHSDFIEVNSNEIISITCENKANGQFEIVEYDKNKKILKYNIVDYVHTEANNKYTITTTKTTKYIIGAYRNNLNMNNIMVVKGAEVLPYNPNCNGMGSVKLIKCNKNLSKYKTFTSTSSARVVGDTTTSGQQIKGIKVRKGKKYTISFDVVSLPSSDYRIQIRESTDESVAQTNGEIPNSIQNEPLTCNTLTRYSKTITAQGDNYLYIRCIPNGFVLDNIQVEEKEISTSSEQHEEQSYILPVQQPMRSIGDIRDTFIKKENKWYERHYVQRLILNGTEGWNYDKSNNRFYFAKAGNKGSGYIMSSHYSKGNTTKQDNTCEIWTTAILFRNESITGLEDFKNMIKTKYDEGIPVYVDYILETPVDIECTEEQSQILEDLNNTRTYKNVTNITTDSIAILDLDYAKDLETLLTSKESEV